MKEQVASSAPLASVFTTAGQALRKIINVESPAEPMMQEMLHRLDATSEWRPLYFLSQSWFKNHDYFAHAKYGTLKYDDNYSLVREKFLTDVGYAAGFPIPTCGFYQLHQEDKYGTGQKALLSILPQPYKKTESARTYLKNRFYDDEELRELGVAEHYETFFSHHPHLAAAFCAITVMDVWMGNTDRHLANLVIERFPNSQQRSPRLWAPDLDINILIPQVSSGNKMKQHDFFFNTLAATPAHKAAIEAALMAIETFPDEQINYYAERLKAISPRYPAERDASLLKERKTNVREEIVQKAPHLGL